MCALLLAAGAQLSLPVGLRYLIDQGLLADSTDNIDRYFIALFLVTVAFGVFSAWRFYLVTWLGELKTNYGMHISTANFDESGTGRVNCSLVVVKGG